MKRIIMMICLVAGMILETKAQQYYGQGGQQPRPSRTFFVPHWNTRIQLGIAHDVGEGDFLQQMSPAFQITLGYKFNELFGIRGGLSGLWARNHYVVNNEKEKYQWNFIQPSVDAVFDLTTIFDGSAPERVLNVYAFAGIGLAYSFNNDDAVNAWRLYGKYGYFDKIWKDTRLNPAIRAGLGIDYRFNDRVALNGELNNSLLPDHFNSKGGSYNNLDWHFNLLFGLKFTIGRSYGRLEPESVREVLPPKPVQKEVAELPVEKISFNVNIFFQINESLLRLNQLPKMRSLVKYLQKHPKAYVRLSAYTDKNTGTEAINMRLSQERVQVVSQYLEDEGIEKSRIRLIAEGSHVQPFDIPSDNRVCICFVYDSENPVPQTFEYEQ